MKKLIFTIILISFGFGIYDSLRPKCNIPQFTEEENRIICIEEGIL